MRSTTLLIFFTLFSSTLFAANAYVIPAQLSSPGGFFIHMLANDQGPYLCKVDTTSRFLMLPGDPKICPTCDNPKGITPTRSLGRVFKISYAASEQTFIAHNYMTTVRPSETLSGNGVPEVKQGIGLITTVDGERSTYGILGMAQPVKQARNRYGLTTYLGGLLRTHAIRDLRFMMVGCLHAKTGSELVLGGIDPRLDNVEPITVPLIPTEAQYVIAPIGLAMATSEKTRMVGRFHAPMKVDTGTDDIRLTADLYWALIERLKQSVRLPHAFWRGHAAYLSEKQLDKFPTLLMIFKDDVKLMIPPAAYVMRDPEDRELHVLMIHNAGEKWSTLGNAIFAAYAVSFNRSTESVQFYDNAGLCS